MPHVILVIDMLRGFLEPGAPLYCGDAARAIVPRVRRFLEDAVDTGATLIFLCDHHLPEDAEFLVFPPHCVRGTDEVELIPELAHLPGQIIPKTRYSGFFGTDLDERLRQLAPEVVSIVGVCTDICVLHTAADARCRDYRVEVPADCVASFDPEAHRFALAHLERVLGVRVLQPA